MIICDMPESLQKMVSDYKINVIDIRRFEDTSVFKTDIRQVFDFIRCSDDEEKLGQLVEGDAYYQHMEDDAYEVVTKYTNSAELISKEEYAVEGGRYNVCKAMIDMINKGRAEGRAEGRAQGSRETLIMTAKNFFANGASYELVRASIKEFTDEELLSIYKEVCA